MYVYMCMLVFQLPVTLVLRLWDIYLLEGEKLLLAMAYNILKMHSSMSFLVTSSIFFVNLIVYAY